MRIRHLARLFPFAFVLLLLLGADSPTRELPPDAEVRRIIEDRVSSGASYGIVVGLLDSGGSRVVAAGAAGGSPERSLDGKSLFEIGSITKTFTATLLARMVEDGRVSLSDPIGRYLPHSVRAPSYQGRPITLLDLATQSSGLPRLPTNIAPRDPSNPYADYTVANLYDFLSHYELTRAPGAVYEYSNLGFGLLGQVLSIEAGKGYGELLASQVLEPLKMHDTTIALTAAMRGRLAVGHDADGHPVSNWDIPTLAGAGALRSTASDMLKYLAAELGDADSGSLAKAIAATQIPRRRAGAPDAEIGLAWQIFHKYGIDLYWHNGETGGYHAFVGFVPRRGTGVVVLSNSSTDIDDIGLHLLEARYTLAALHKAVEVDPKILEDYVGEYRLSPTFSMNITREGDALYVQATGQEKLPIYPESKTSFFLRVVNAQITFVRRGDGTVVGLILHQGGREAPGKKVR